MAQQVASSPLPQGVSSSSQASTQRSAAQASPGPQHTPPQSSSGGQQWSPAQISPSGQHSSPQSRMGGQASLSGLSGQVMFLVQAMDAAGNVTVSGNKGRYFEAERSGIYLPIITNNLTR